MLKIGDGGDTESFAALGAASTTSMSINNRPADATTMCAGGIHILIAAAGVQDMQVRLDGLFKDSCAEETLRAAAFNRTANNADSRNFVRGAGRRICHGSTAVGRYVMIEIVRADELDVIEAKFEDFRLTNVSYDSQIVAGNLTIEGITSEPFPAAIFSPGLLAETL